MDIIYAHIAADSPEAAGRVIKGIYDKAQILKEHPQIGWRYMEITDREIRVLLQGHYRIVYWFRSKDRIEILGVYHAALDMDSRLK